MKKSITYRIKSFLSNYWEGLLVLFIIIFFLITMCVIDVSEMMHRSVILFYVR